MSGPPPRPRAGVLFPCQQGAGPSAYAGAVVASAVGRRGRQHAPPLPTRPAHPPPQAGDLQDEPRAHLHPRGAWLFWRRVGCCCCCFLCAWARSLHVFTGPKQLGCWVLSASVFPPWLRQPTLDPHPTTTETTQPTSQPTARPGDRGHRRQLHVHLPDGLPRRLPADRAHAAHLEHLWPNQGLLAREALAAGVL